MSVHSDQAPSPVAAVVILAAGEGKRMKSSRSKLLHQIAGHSMLSYAVTAATTVQPEHIVVVVGHLRARDDEVGALGRGLDRLPDLVVEDSRPFGAEPPEVGPGGSALSPSTT